MRVAQVLITLLVVGFAAWYLRRQWLQAAETGVSIHFQLGWLLGASAMVLLTFTLLVETWRRVLARLGATISFATAARIWFVSNLGKYVPGRIWQVTTMAVMSAERGVPIPTIGASAALLAVANVATGFAVILIMSAGIVERLAGGMAGVVAATVGLFLLLGAAPLLAAKWNKLAERYPAARLQTALPTAAVVVAVVGCAVSWFLYGLAFLLFVRALIGSASAPYSAYVTANAAAYLVGYLAIMAPAGIGFREVALASILVPLKIASAPQAAVITVASRIWLTVLELAPALVALAARRWRPAASAGSVVPR